MPDNLLGFHQQGLSNLLSGKEISHFVPERALGVLLDETSHARTIADGLDNDWKNVAFLHLGIRGLVVRNHGLNHSAEVFIARVVVALATTATENIKRSWLVVRWEVAEDSTFALLAVRGFAHFVDC